MCKTQSSFKLFAGALALAAVVTLPTAARAAAVTLNVDSALSSLTMSGAAFGLNVSAQKPGSLVDAWGGTITGDLSGGVFTFTGSSAITALLNPANPFSTAPYPNNGLVDNYGVHASGLVTGVGLVLSLDGAYRSLTLDITSGTAANGAAASGMNLAFTSGTLTFGAIVSPNIPYGGSSDLIGVNGANTSAGLVSWDGTTLTLPIQLHTIGSNRYEDWSGTIVATVVPEPSALALLGVGLMGLVGVQFRRSRHSL
ncbi:MAG: PEP-CTERM sorting domain-containing protein [Verrucomicrobia subdivision 3 bacterium]|nr:PEP-CTERM sorting domain-containing protein [Limisphaerales bacterium]